MTHYFNETEACPWILTIAMGLVKQIAYCYVDINIVIDPSPNSFNNLVGKSNNSILIPKLLFHKVKKHSSLYGRGNVDINSFKFVLWEQWFKTHAHNPLPCGQFIKAFLAAWQTTIMKIYCFFFFSGPLFSKFKNIFQDIGFIVQQKDSYLLNIKVELDHIQIYNSSSLNLSLLGAQSGPN